MEQRFNRDNLPVSGWERFRKRTVTTMTRIYGPFMVVTREGEVFCDDGWLAKDYHGWPYPIAADEQAAVYEAAE